MLLENDKELTSVNQVHFLSSRIYQIPNPIYCFFNIGSLMSYYICRLTLIIIYYPYMKKYVLTILIMLLVTTTTYAQKQMVITIDDLPYNGRDQNIALARESVKSYTEHLRHAGVGATAFITVQNILIDDEVDDRFQLMELWKNAGVEIENHGYRHLSHNKVSPQDFYDDILFAELFLENEVKDDSSQIRYFRAPYNHVGADSQKAQELIKFLKTRTIQLVPFTLEHGDYIYNRVYLHYLNSGNSKKAEEIRREYIAQLSRSLNFIEDLTFETFNQRIPQILLIHANAINAVSIDEMINFLKQEGYTFISLEQALEHEVYNTESIYPSPWGISWVHRWRKAMDLSNELRKEPEPDAEIMKLWQEL